MPIAIDNETARSLLEELIDEAEYCLSIHSVEASILGSVEDVIRSATGAYRQALVGTCIVKLLAPHADLTLPSVEHGEFAYSGRTIDEAVVMPIFRRRRIPVSASSAYLSTLRRGKRFLDLDVVGTRDRNTYLAANAFVGWLQSASPEAAKGATLALLAGFLRLREERQIALIHIKRISAGQVEDLVTGLLQRQSGGAFPMMVVVATLEALNEAFNHHWEIEAQGINSADVSSGAIGDVTVRLEGEIIFAIEVTERQVDADRVRSAMIEKVMPANVTDYLYLVTVEPTAEAKSLAQAYFGQGYDVGFLPIEQWSRYCLSMTAKSRAVFVTRLREAFNRDHTPAAHKVAWNDVAALIV